MAVGKAEQAKRANSFWGLDPPLSRCYARILRERGVAMRQLNVRDPWVGLAYQDDHKAAIEDLIARIQILENRVRELENSIREAQKDREPVVV